MKKLFYIDYPQERFEGHLPSCQYRIDLEKAGYEPEPVVAHLELNTSDEVD